MYCAIFAIFLRIIMFFQIKKFTKVYCIINLELNDRYFYVIQDIKEDAAEETVLFSFIKPKK